MKRRTLLISLLLFLASVLQLTAQNNTDIQSAEDSGAEVYIIPIHGEINRALTVFIRRGLQEADSTGATRVIFDIDTFGGRVDAALQIATLIGGAEDVETIAWVPAAPETTAVSWSAGALISLACERIYMAPGTSLGAAAPVYSGTQGSEAAPEKVVSAVRAQMAALAEKNGYPKAVAAAMVDMDIELVEVRIDGIPQLVDVEETASLKKTAEEAGRDFEEVRIVSKAGKLLALTAGEMKYYGISSGTPSSLEELLGELELEGAESLTYEESTADRIIAAVTGSVLTTLIIMVGLGALYLEITSPGFGVPGTIAVIAFAILFAGNFLLGTAGSLEILIFLLGIVLLVVEIVLIPGFGITGILGILLIVGSLIISRQDFIIPEFTWQREVLERNFITIGSGLLGSIVIGAVFFRFFHRIPGLKTLVLQETQDPSRGFHVQEREVKQALTGETGRTITPLRPSGKGEFGDRILVIESEGDFLETGREVVITEVNGNRIKVREA